MDGRRPGALSDEALDRELQAALDVEPSPEFLARVRLRVASEPAPVPWRMPWAWIAPAAAAAVIVVAVVMWTAPVNEPLAPRQAVTTLPVEPDVAPALPPPARVVATRPTVMPRTRVERAAPVTTPASHVATVERPPFPEVLVSADEVRAYQRLLGIVEQQRLPPPSAAAAIENGDETFVELSDIQLASLRIEALPALSRLEGER